MPAWRTLGNSEAEDITKRTQTIVDAITLSLAELSGTAGGIELTTAARAVMLAALANTVIKGSIVLVRGSSELRRVIAPILTLMILVGGSIALLI
jgi:uncharacterized membrane protein (DUF4010 family)